MTAPSLHEIRAWDAFAVRGSVAVLEDVAGRLPSWRSRVEAVGRELDAAECWSGPAATVAAGAVVGLSTVATAVAAAVARSADALERLAAEAMAAHEHAVEALGVAAVAGVHLDAWGRPDPPVALPSTAANPAEAARLAARARIADQAAELAAEARRRGALALAAADAAEQAFGALRAWHPSLGFTALGTGIGPVWPATAPAPPSGGPEEVATWWSGLSLAAQLMAIWWEPNRIGGLNGVPAWARDRANRILLARTLDRSRGEPPPMAAAVAAQLEVRAAAGQEVQLLEFDLAHQEAAVAVGDVDTADAVAVLVPGILTSVEGDLGAMLTNGDAVANAARVAVPGLAVATVAWLGYSSPDRPSEILGRGNARRGGIALDATLAGLAAAREATGRPQPRTTVLAHSYGTVVTDEAAERPGRLAADAVVLMGSPGMKAEGDLRTEVPELYDAVGGKDPIAWVPWFGGDEPLDGTSPWEAGYGAVELPFDPDMGHTDYYDPERPVLPALGEVVAGTRTHW